MPEIDLDDPTQIGLGPDRLAQDLLLPPLPPIDTRHSIGYDAIRYIPGYTADFCKEYAVRYAMEVLRQERARGNR